MSESTPKPFIPEEEHRPEPGYGLALLTVAVMLIVTAILCILIYGLMVAISPLEARKPRAATPAEVPVAPSQAPTPPQPRK